MSATASNTVGGNMDNLIIGEFEDSTTRSPGGDTGTTGNVVAMIGCAVILLLMIAA